MLYRVLKPRRTALLGGMAVFCAAALYSQPSVLTWHNDNARTGQNLQETILTTANVNVSTFGKLFTIGVDGLVDGQPLYVPGLTIPGQGVHNVLYIATEHDSVYAFDADSGALLKQVTLLEGSETSSDDRGCSQVTPEIGVTATPVIDPHSGPHGTIYVVAMSKLTSGSTVTYYQRVHALDLTTLAEEFGGPVEVAATYPGTGDESTFLPAQHKDRAALLLANGIVYISWSSHCDDTPYTSWVIGYNESTLAQETVLNLVPNGTQGGIWASGSGPQADTAGNVYVPTGNGTFDTTLTGAGFPSGNDYGNAYVKMSSSGGHLAVADYFTMSGTVSESGTDTDLGSGGGMLLPPLNDTNGHSRNLAVVAGKDSNIYVMDTAGLGKFNPNADEMYQQLTGVLPGGMWGSPAWFNGTLYYGDQGNALKAFAFSNGTFETSPGSQTSVTFPYPGTTPSISANETSNGIVWATVGSGSGVLHAYNAGNLSEELYNSNQAANARDQFGGGNKFVFPTIVNGKVYVASIDGVNNKPGSVAAFGLLGEPPAVVSVSPNSGSGSSQTFAFAFSDPNGATDIASTQMVINSALAVAGSCYLYYARASNAIYLATDAGAWQGFLTVGTAGTIENSQCVVNAGASTVTASGNNLTLNLALSFTAAFAGAKNIYMEVQNSTSDSGWAQRGAWTAVAPLSPSYALGMTPASRSVAAGANTTYTVTVTGSNGFSGTVNLGVSGLPAGVTGSFNPTSVAGSGSSTLTINAGASAAAGSYTATVTGTSGSLSEGTSAGLTITGSSSSGPPVTVSVTPNSGSGASQTFAFAFSDPNGATDIVSSQIVINSTLAAAGSCYFYYARATNAIYLANDAGAWQGNLTVGTAGTMQNSQCVVNAGASTVTASGNNLTLNLALSFTTAFAGAKNIYMEVQNATEDSGWAQRGAWTVTSGSSGNSSSPPSPVSVTPNSGAGSSQTFAFAFSDPNGATDIVSTQMVVNSTLAAAGSCYLYYARAANAIYLATDAGAWQGFLTVGTAGTMQNSQCVVNAGASSVTASGDNLTLNLALSFNAGFAGAKNIYMEVQNATLDSGWAQRGTWTVSSGGAAPSPPASVSVTPNSGSGSSQTFAFAFSDSSGATDIVSTQMVINSTLAAAGSCYFYYVPASKLIYLATDAGAWQGFLTIGTAGTMQNSHCTVDAGASSVTSSGNNLTLNLALSFNAGFAGAKNIYMEVQNATLDSGWAQRGAWTVP